MSFSAQPSDASPFRSSAGEPSAASLDRQELAGWEAHLEKASEWLNPILVKEARQALKSRQFLITFTSLLSCALIWTWLGIALLMPAVEYTAGGPFMLTGYYLILVLPVLIIVPFSAFRSLAAEREDGTYQLVSITTLPARQIITGKLGSAILQLLIYYSALAPCLGFTYLLRGLDIPTILTVLVLTGILSILLSSLGLVIATWARVRHWQVALSVILVIVLSLSALTWTIFIFSLIEGNFQLAWDQSDTWVMLLSVMIFLASFSVLFITMAAAISSFASDNRSTPIRYVALGQQVIWVVWMTYFWLRGNDNGLLNLLVVGAMIYWFILGSLLIGESGLPSPRVRRSLPQSFLGRLFFTWFNPGSGTAYVFVVSNMMALLLSVFLLEGIAPLIGVVDDSDVTRPLLQSLGCTTYLVFYLGSARLLLLALRQLAALGPGVSLILTILLLLLGCLLPIVIAGQVMGYTNMEYNLLQITNWYWTLDEITNFDSLAIRVVLPFLILLAAIIFLINLIQATDEIGLTRLPTPLRVQADPTHAQHSNSPERSHVVTPSTRS